MLRKVLALCCAALLPLQAAAEIVAPVNFSAVPEAPAFSPAAPAPTDSAGLKPEVAQLLAPVAAALQDLPPETLAQMPPDQASQAVGRLFEPALAALPAAEGEPEGPSAAPGAPAPGGSRPSRLSGVPDASLARRVKIVRAVLSPIVRLFYRTRAVGLQNVPAQGPAFILPNHVALIDGVLLSFIVKRPIRYVMYRKYYEPLKWILKPLGVIPISEDDGPKELAKSMAQVRAALRAGELVGLFPEGSLTRNGNMAKFKRGFERIAKGMDVPRVPVHLDGFWSSISSRKPGRTWWQKLTLALPLALTVRFGAAMPNADTQAVREAVQQLGAESFRERVQNSKTLARAFLETAKKNWSRPAAADSTGQALSYGKTLVGAVLLSQVLAPRLTAAKNVGVLLPAAVSGVLGNLALGALGKVPVNLNYTASQEAVDYAVQKSGIERVVTSRLFLKLLEKKTGQKIAVKADLIYLEDLLPLITPAQRARAYAALRLLPRWLIERIYFKQAATSLDETAAILFTSGSSALPKGVELTHANIQSNVEMVRRVFPFRKNDGVLGVLPFFHCFGLTVTLWLPLVAGLGAVYHANPLDTDVIGRLAAKYRPTLLLGTPTFLSFYARRIPKEAFASIRYVIAGAEKLRPAVGSAFREKFGRDILEGYGATELSPIAAVNLPDDPAQVGTKPGTIGQPLPGVAMRVVDPDTRKPLPYGTPGLLLVRGANVMKGYLGEPKKTAEVIQDGWYVTGDMASIDADGFVTMTGRLSRFTKIGGEMVPHGAVEEKLQQAAGVSEQIFVVTSVADEARGERLVVLYAGYEGSVSELLKKAQALGLPNLWTPAANAFYKIDKIPLLGTGKLDLKAVNELAKALAQKK